MDITINIKDIVFLKIYSFDMNLSPKERVVNKPDSMQNIK